MGLLDSLTAPEPDTVSAAEFEQMKRDLEIDEQEAALSPRQTSTLTKRLAHTAEPEAPGPAARRTRAGADGASRAERRKTATRSAPPAPEEIPPAATPEAEPPAPAPDIPENEGVAPAPKPRPKASSSRSRNRRHGRRR